ncbi:hypothetical protein [Flavobacterium lindanitolerans]|jgi:hypothetical protein|uniref:hypothetical protein n=1 Tax=Flavobacterium lindanitolerans TaxID=428988 RepID=UPI0023F351C0|nr:hypothetical protein [Flavobacterium lindanitolerans]
MKKIYLILLLLVSISAFSQRKSEKEILGYACGYSGEPTSVIIKFGGLLYEKKYKSIKALLYSKIPVENFLAVVISKKLADKKNITLTKSEMERIDELHKSTEKVPICGGCTYYKEIELNKLLKSKEDVHEATDYFFD